jgi:hypothetical protein
MLRSLRDRQVPEWTRGFLSNGRGTSRLKKNRHGDYPNHLVNKSLHSGIAGEQIRPVQVSGAIDAKALSGTSDCLTFSIQSRLRPVVVNSDSPRRQLVQQSRYCGGHLTGSRYHHCPFQVLSELFGDDVPLIERRRRCSSDLNEGPVSDQRQRVCSVRQRATHDEMIVAGHQNTGHADLMPPGADRESDNRSRNGTPPAPVRAPG